MVTEWKHFFSVHTVWALGCYFKTHLKHCECFLQKLIQETRGVILQIHGSDQTSMSEPRFGLKIVLFWFCCFLSFWWKTIMWKTKHYWALSSFEIFMTDILYRSWMPHQCWSWQTAHATPYIQTGLLSQGKAYRQSKWQVLLSHEISNVHYII